MSDLIEGPSFYSSKSKIELRQSMQAPHSEAEASRLLYLTIQRIAEAGDEIPASQLRDFARATLSKIDASIL